MNLRSAKDHWPFLCLFALVPEAEGRSLRTEWRGIRDALLEHGRRKCRPDLQELLSSITDEYDEGISSLNDHFSLLLG
jgi:hypothetical protein